MAVPLGKKSRGIGGEQIGQLLAPKKGREFGPVRFSPQTKILPAANGPLGLNGPDEHECTARRLFTLRAREGL